MPSSVRQACCVCLCGMCVCACAQVCFEWRRRIFFVLRGATGVRVVTFDRSISHCALVSG